MDNTIHIVSIDKTEIPERGNSGVKTIDYFHIVKCFLETHSDAGIIHLPYELKAMFDPHNVNSNSLAKSQGVSCIMRKGNLYLIKSK